jgi:hypothetical protein
MGSEVPAPAAKAKGHSARPAYRCTGITQLRDE